MVYVSETGPKNNRTKRLAIMDQDGASHRFLTNGQFKHGAAAGLVLSHWDPATDATFDTGVLMLGAGESGCVWVAEED